MKTNTILTLLFIVLAGSTIAQDKIEFTYDAAGNRTNRQLVPGLVKKDTTIKTLPVSMDSLLITSMDTPEDTSVKPDASPNKEQEKVFKTWIGEQNIAIYPNPTQGYLTVGLKNFDEVKSCSIEIIDMNGSVVYQSTSPQRVYSVDLSNRANGNYYINLRVNGLLGSFVVVKQ